MNQNDIDREFAAQELTEFDGALDKLETLTKDLPVLSPEEKAAHVRPPDGAGEWMEGMATRAEQNINKLPRDYDPARAQRDFKLDAVLEPRELRLARVLDRINNARFLARSDLFATMLGVRRQLKEAGVAGVDDNLSDGLRRFFSRSGGAKPAPASPAAPK
ncbi:MAG: hypothetical protein HZA90_27425 [Verrucomicrobia bacterium]|nr:hypothetical protein [Verrucomicrobiota bacterium]